MLIEDEYHYLTGGRPSIVANEREFWCDRLAMVICLSLGIGGIIVYSAFSH